MPSGRAPRHAAAVLGLVALSLAVFPRQATLTGLKNDGAEVAYCARRLVSEEPPFGALRGWHVGRWTLPLEYVPWEGPWQIYETAALLWLGVPDERARLAQERAWATLSVLATYGAACFFSGSLWIGMLCALALLCSAPFNVCVHLGLQGGVTTTALFPAAIGLLAAASLRRRAAYWWASCAATGLAAGLDHRSLALLLAAWPAVVALQRSRLCGYWTPRWRTAAAGLLLLGALLPLFASLCLNHEWGYVWSALRVSHAGHRNAQYARHLALRLGQVRALFGRPEELVEGGVRVDPSGLWSALLGAAGLAWGAGIFLGRRPATRIASIPFVAFGAGLLVSPFTLRGLTTVQVVFLLPAALVCLAAVPRHFHGRPRRLAFAGLAALLAAGVVANALELLDDWRLKEARGDVFASQPSQIYPLADWLRRSPEEPSCVYSFGAAGSRIPLLYLTHGSSARIEDCSAPRSSEAEVAGLDRFLAASPQGRIIVQPRPDLNAPLAACAAAVEGAAKRHGGSVGIGRQFLRRDGTAAYVVYEWRASGRAARIPPAGEERAAR